MKAKYLLAIFALAGMQLAVSMQQINSFDRKIDITGTDRARKIELLMAMMRDFVMRDQVISLAI